MINEYASMSIVEEDLREKLANFCREQHKDCLLAGMVYKKGFGGDSQSVYNVLFVTDDPQEEALRILERNPNFIIKEFYVIAKDYIKRYPRREIIEDHFDGVRIYRSADDKTMPNYYFRF